MLKEREKLLVGFEIFSLVLGNIFISFLRLQIFTSGEYRSIEHRAIVNSDKERLSVATFYSSNLDSELGPAPSLIGADNPAIFRTVPIEMYFKEFFARKLNGKSYLDFMKIEGEDASN